MHEKNSIQLDGVDLQKDHDWQPLFLLHSALEIVGLFRSFRELYIYIIYISKAITYLIQLELTWLFLSLHLQTDYTYYLHISYNTYIHIMYMYTLFWELTYILNMWKGMFPSLHHLGCFRFSLTSIGTQVSNDQNHGMFFISIGD